MCKDRVRSVGWSKHRSSPHHAVLTTARVGPYYHIRTIYIRRYDHRPTTLILYTSHRATYLWDHIIYKATEPRSHRPTGSPGATFTWITNHRKPPHTHTHWINWLISGYHLAHHWGCEPPSTPVLHLWVTGLPLYHRTTLPPSHRLIRPLIQRATPTITTFITSQYWQPPAHHLPSNCVCEFTIMPSSKW